MKKLVYILTLLLFTISNVFSQTSVPGGIVNGTWTLSGSPYNVQGSIQIVNGDSLIIQPGVTVNFQGHYKLLVLGKLKAIGTVTDTITFTAADTVNGWRGIRFDNTPSTNDTSRITYCKLQYGNASGSGNDYYGGGIHFDRFSKVVVSHSSIINCRAEEGSGISIIVSSPVITNNSISNNISTNGGTIYIIAGSPTIINNTISNNTGSKGAGINLLHNSSGTPIINNNIISNNTARLTGGGIYCNSYAIINNNSIINNTSNNIGGGIFCASDAIISNNIISNNTALGTQFHYSGGGGIYIVSYNASGTAIFGNIISNNSANNNGGGILCYYSSPTFTNNTIVNNNASNNGGALCCVTNVPYTDIPIFRNCILWGNTATTSGDQVFLHDEPSDPDFYYCDVEDGSSAFELNGNFYTGAYSNNINTDPLFIAPSGGSGTGFSGINADWSLQSNSPCIDAGDPIGTYPPTDIADNTRVVGGVIDIGAYEWDGGVVPSHNISGQISTENGKVTIGVMHVLDANLDSSQTPVKTVLVDSSGAYQFLDIPEGDYKIKALPGIGYDHIYLPTYYGDKIDWGSAYTLNVNSTTGSVDIHLVSITSSIESNSIENYIKMYPNPTNGSFTIESLDKILRIEAMNISGQLIYLYDNDNSNITYLNIDFSSKPKGIYFIKIIGKSHISVERLILE